MAGFRNTLIIKRKGTIETSQDIHPLIDYWFRTCSNGEYVLSLTRVSKPRSVSQNKLMWLWFTAISEAWTEACGYTITPQDVHEAYCMLFLPKDTPKGKIAGSTSTLSKEQFADFLNKVQADVQTEYGIQLPNPEDYYFEMWAKQYNNKHH